MNSLELDFDFADKTSKPKKGTNLPVSGANSATISVDRQLMTIFENCLESLRAGKYKVVKLNKNAQVPAEIDPVEEATTFLLYLGAKKLGDKRFAKLYDYVLVPEPKRTKNPQAPIDISPFDVFNFISPGSEGFGV